MRLPSKTELLWPIGLIVLFASIGVILALIVFSQWEVADSARAYAYGHSQLGLCLLNKPKPLSSNHIEHSMLSESWERVRACILEC